MYAKFILAAQIVLFSALQAEARLQSLRTDGRSLTGGLENVALAQTAPLQIPSKRYGIIDEKVLRQYVDQSVQNIKRISKSSQYTKQQKLDYIRRTVDSVSAYRANNWTKSSFAEHQMDLTIKPYESFPEAQKFQARSCDQYQHRLILEWEPDAQNMRPVQKGVSEALTVLRQICRS